MKVIFNISVVAFLAFSCSQDLDSDIDPWRYEQPQVLGVNAGLLLKMDEDIQSRKFNDIHSLMIIKSDKVIFENYYNGYNRNDLQDLNRASQGIFYLALKAAFSEASLEFSDKIIDQLPEYEAIFDNIPQKDKIEIQHLINQTSGFNWPEWNFVTKAKNSRLVEMEQSSDWVEFVLSTNMIREPGMDFNFNSGHSMILSAILEDKLPTSLEEFIDKNLFDPLHIDNYRWEKTPNQLLNTASGLQMKTADMAKIGYLMLKNGTFEGESVVDSQWVDTLTTTIASSDYYRVGRNWFKFNGYHPVAQGLADNDIFFTWGEGGQFIFVAPHLEMVTVITAGNYDDNREFNIFYLLKDYILPALNESIDVPTYTFND